MSGISEVSPPNHVAPSKEDDQKHIGLAKGRIGEMDFVDAQCRWRSLRQFGQVDFLPMFMMFYEDV